jgi:hypothetical protein
MVKIALASVASLFVCAALAGEPVDLPHDGLATNSGLGETTSTTLPPGMDPTGTRIPERLPTVPGPLPGRSEKGTGTGTPPSPERPDVPPPTLPPLN